MVSMRFPVTRGSTFAPENQIPAALGFVVGDHVVPDLRGGGPGNGDTAPGGPGPVLLDPVALEKRGAGGGGLDHDSRSITRLEGRK